EVVGLHIGWLLPVHGRSGWQASHESLDNLAGNFVLNAEDVFHRSVQAFSPNMPARDRVNQLNIDSKTSCRPPSVAFENVTDAQTSGDITDIDRLALVRKRRIACDNEQTIYAGEVRDQVLCQPVSEELVFRIAAQILERQDDDRCLVR